MQPRFLHAACGRALPVSATDREIQIATQLDCILSMLQEAAPLPWKPALPYQRYSGSESSQQELFAICNNAVELAGRISYNGGALYGAPGLLRGLNQSDGFSALDGLESS
jgi:hypothetical protein